MNFFSKDYLLLFSLLFCVFISWFILKPQTSSLDESQHIFLQESFQARLAEYVDKNYPHITSLTFERVWTETVKHTAPYQVRVHFLYKLELNESEGESLLSIKGQALLTEQETGAWMLGDFQVTNSVLDLKEPLLIKANK